MNHTFKAYFYAEVFGAVGFVIILMIGIIIFACLPVFRPGKSDSFSTTRTLVQWLFPFVRKVGDNETLMFGRRIRKIALIWLAIIVSLIIANTSAIFWINFFIEQSSSCGTNFDCFPIDNVNKIINMEALNCNSQNNIQNIQCFKFSCNIGNAIGNATGALGFTWISATFCMWFILQLGLFIKKEGNSKKNVLASFLVCFQVFVILSWVALMVTVISKFYAERTISLTCTIQVFTFCFLMSVSGFTPWCDFFEKETERDKKRSIFLSTDKYHVEVIVEKENVRVLTGKHRVTIHAINLEDCY